MKKLQINPTATTEIDWSKKQYVQVTTEPYFIVATTGKHNGDNFSGYAHPCESYPQGEYDTKWDKDQFVLFSGEAKLIISNED